MDENIERHYPIPLTPQPTSHPLAVLWSFIGGALLLVFLIAGIIAAHDQFIQGATFMVWLLIILAVVVVPGGVIFGLVAFYRLHRRSVRLKDLEVEQAEVLVQAQRAKVEQVRAQTELLRTRITADDNGNYPIFHDPTIGQFHQFAPGQYKQPVASSLHYSIRNESLPGGNTPQGLLPEPSSGAAAAPEPSECLRQVQRNSLQLCVGRSLKTAEYRVVQLPGAHILLIGSSQKGKSTQAAWIMEQLTTTHDPEVVQLALLDLEDMTCNLFAGAPHVLSLRLENGRTIKAIARSATEVVRYLFLLRQHMDYRYTLSPKDRAALPHVVIYIEEFLELKRRIKGEQLAQLADDFTSLATRGLKANMHLLVCAQASYSTEEFREAMGQLVGINMAFCAPPRLAQAAGFWEFDLLKQNFNAKVPGQFVLEATGCTDLCLAPVYQLQAKLHAMQEEEEARVSGAHVVVSEVQERPNERRLLAFPGGAHVSRTPDAPASHIGAHPDTLAWEAYVDVIDRLQQEGKNQDEIIEKIWHAKKGSGNKKYQAGREIYRRCIAVIKQRKQAAFDRVAGGDL